MIFPGYAKQDMDMRAAPDTLEHHEVERHHQPPPFEGRARWAELDVEAYEADIAAQAMENISNPTRSGFPLRRLVEADIAAGAMENIPNPAMSGFPLLKLVEAQSRTTPSRRPSRTPSPTGRVPRWALPPEAPHWSVPAEKKELNLFDALRKSGELGECEVATPRGPVMSFGPKATDVAACSQAQREGHEKLEDFQGRARWAELDVEGYAAAPAMENIPNSKMSGFPLRNLAEDRETLRVADQEKVRSEWVSRQLLGSGSCKGAGKGEGQAPGSQPQWSNCNLSQVQGQWSQGQPQAQAAPASRPLPLALHLQQPSAGPAPPVAVQPPPVPDWGPPSTVPGASKVQRRGKGKGKGNAPTPSSSVAPPICEVSAGTVGHPFTCAAPCKYATKSGGCKDGAACDRCHLCKWKRSTESRRCGSSAWSRGQASTNEGQSSQAVQEERADAGHLWLPEQTIAPR